MVVHVTCDADNSIVQIVIHAIESLPLGIPQVVHGIPRLRAIFHVWRVHFKRDNQRPQDHHTRRRPVSVRAAHGAGKIRLISKLISIPGLESKVVEAVGRLHRPCAACRRVIERRQLVRQRQGEVLVVLVPVPSSCVSKVLCLLALLRDPGDGRAGWLPVHVLQFVWPTRIGCRDVVLVPRPTVAEAKKSPRFATPAQIPPSALVGIG